MLQHLCYNNTSVTSTITKFLSFQTKKYRHSKLDINWSSVQTNYQKIKEEISANVIGFVIVNHNFCLLVVAHCTKFSLFKSTHNSLDNVLTVITHEGIHWLPLHHLSHYCTIYKKYKKKLSTNNNLFLHYLKTIINFNKMQHNLRI